MPRASRIFVPGCAWHVTHRCHDREFLLRARIDRDGWRRWLYEASQRYGLCVLDYIITRNHIHLLVFDARGDEAIARSMQLIEGRTAQAFNRRRQRRGAFWEDRYHAVAVDSGEHLMRCLVYIDLNMVRAGVVAHPSEWPHGGYAEIQRPRARYRILDLEKLAHLCACASVAELAAAHREWVETALLESSQPREACWTEAIAVGSDRFTRRMARDLELPARYHETVQTDTAQVLRKSRGAYARI